MSKFDKFTINQQSTIREAFNKQGLNKEMFVLVLDDTNKVQGIITDGDIRRAIWESVSLEDSVATIVNKNFTSFTENYSQAKAKEIFSTTDVKHIPVLKQGQLIDIIFKKSMSEAKHRQTKTRLDIPVVIMAGGKGSRLDPFTRILPKPLIPIGEKPVIEVIIDKFYEYGFNQFYISLNHKSKMVKAFFEDFGKEYKLSYLEEKTPLGTAGALTLLKNKIKTPLIVSNCDIIIEEDYRQILEFHQQGNYLLTLVGSMQHHVIPYGVCKIKNGGELGELTEKPEYDLLVNTGMYILSPQALDYIPDNQRFDTTDLIDKLKQAGKRVGVYPIAEKSWIDIGQWEEYKKAVDKLESFG